MSECSGRLHSAIHHPHSNFVTRPPERGTNTRMTSTREALRRTFAQQAVRRSLTVALVVGTALNLINQGDALASGHAPVFWKMLLTYFVPFAVASYGSYAAFRTSD